MKSTTQALNKKELIATYFQIMKKDFLDHDVEAISHTSDKSDASMATSGQSIFQDSQDVEPEPNFYDIFDNIQAELEKRLARRTIHLGESSQTKDKNQK
ncbi:unnamed protein product [Rhodiola kirilowii]